MMAYWDWWVGALALGSITFFITCLLGADSVSLVHGNESSIGKLHAKPNEATRRSRQHPTTSKRRSWQQRNLNSALAGAASPFRRPPDQAVESTPPPQTRLPMTANATLLVTILLGAFGAALINGRFKIAGDMGPAFADIVVDGPLLWPNLFVGGVLVGIGTRMAGGCSSGHGMSGCSRLQPVSLVATSVFFGTAVAVSSLLLWVI